MMKKVQILIWIPFLLGLLLLVIAKINLYQFSSGSIEVRSMLSREIPIVSLGLICSILIFLSSIYWLLKKQWAIALQAIVSPALFLLCFIIGGAMGAAFLNAT